MEFKLTIKRQHAHFDKDKHHRNYLLVFINNICIFKQKIPFDTDYEAGYDMKPIYNIYILNGRLHQTRKRKGVEKDVSYPLSKKRLEAFNIPEELRIDTSKYVR